MPSIIISKNNHDLMEYKISSSRTLIGRSDACDIALPDELVSRTHCVIDFIRNELWVTDRSRHGTYLNGKNIKKIRLSEGDKLKIGSHILTVSLASTVKPPPTATSMSISQPAMIIAADNGEMRVVNLYLEVLEGPEVGKKFPIPNPTINVGAPPSQISMEDPSLLYEHFYIFVNRDRAMIRPHRGSIMIDNERVIGQYPVYPNESFQAGNSVFRLTSVEADERFVSNSFGDLIGNSPAMHGLFGQLQRMAYSDLTVLLYGESGTGKELAARGLHDLSPRAANKFVAVNCAAISDNLFESELFGHERGSFTGATESREGCFQEAHNGTLFLDEIGEIPPAAQAKLLRALESGEVRKVGANISTFPNVRVVAATNRDLWREVQSGRFRKDLYFRLAVIKIIMPPLREHMEDIEALAERFAADCHSFLTDNAIDVLYTHHWPGNVRELRNVIHRAAALFGPRINANDITFDSLPTIVEPDPALNEDEKRAILETLDECKGNRSAAARKLGMARTTFLYRLRRMGMETQEKTEK